MTANSHTPQTFPNESIPSDTATPDAGRPGAGTSDAVITDIALDEMPPGADAPIAVVGLGASAGGIRVLQTFLEGMPANSGLAFVVVMHLAPDYESNLANVLQPRTSMPVLQVSEAVQVRANHVYVIPPNKHLSMQDSLLQLTELQQPPGRRVAIDLFFRTLASAYGQRAVCIVLSGTDSDGVIGLKHVKEQGGVTIAQDPEEAEQDSMPRAAIETGMVDWVLPVAAMPAKLVEHARNEQRIRIPPPEPPDEPLNGEATGPGGTHSPRETTDPDDESALHEVLLFLRGQTGYDFGHYKRATVLRRIARRLQVNSLEDIPSYLHFLRTHAVEAGALLHDLLISVTNFFRDKDAFAAFESHIPQLFAGKTANDAVRVWSCGCATGEEAYSLALMLSEHAARLEAPPSIQIFATDIDDEVIAAARSAVYPTTIEADVSPERLRRFFVREQGRYCVRKELRETVLFAAHDVLKDSPFSRLDLITCRNLLIYLKPQAQEQVFGTFHFALRPGGLLFLGGSENMDDAHSLFAPLDKRHRLFVRRATQRPGWQFPIPPAFATQGARPAPVVPHSLTPPPIAPSLPAPAPTPLAMPVAPSTLTHAAKPAPAQAERRTLLFSELHLALLEQLGPPSLVVNANHDIVHLSGRAGQFLQFSGGEPSMNLLQVVHPALRIELRAALFRATRNGSGVQARVPFEMNGSTRLVDIQVRPMALPETPLDAAQGFLLVLFEVADESLKVPERLSPIEPAARHLEEEIGLLKAQLDSTIEQYEASTEELKASNEELQAMNEELRSATEELETGREELQSINEELTTVNQELKSNVEQLSRANSDLQNLMASTEIGTIFLDRELRINRFTPRVQELFNLIATDVGRPLADITHKLSTVDFTANAERVLDSLNTIEHEIASHTDQWFLVRLLPYRTLDNHIDGVVLTFVDITERKRGEAALRASEERFRGIVAQATAGIAETDPDGQFILVNDRECEILGYSREELLGLHMQDITHPDDLARTRELFGRCVAEGEPFVIEKRYLRKDGSLVWASNSVTAIRDSNGATLYALAVSMDITERKRAERNAALLVDISRDLVQIADEAGIVQSVTAKIGAHFGLSQCAFAEIHEATGKAVITDVWHQDGVTPMDDHLGDLLNDALERDAAARDLDTGQILVIGDVVSDARIHDPARFRALQIASFVAVPLVREGQRQFLLAACHSHPGAWCDDEIELTRELTTRLGARLERARAEAALRESEGRFRAIVDQATAGVAEMDLEGRFTLVNQRFCDITGYTRDELLARRLEEITHPDDLAHCLNIFETAVRTGQPSANEKRYVRKDGAPVWVSNSVSVVRGGEGQTQSVVTVALDISARKEAEAELRASEERFRLLVEGTRDYAMFLMDAQRRIVHWNAGAERIFGYTRDEAIGQSGDIIFTPEDRAARAPEGEAQTAATQGQAADVREHQRRDGTRFWADGVMASLHNEDGEARGFVKVARDATKERQAEATLRRAYDDLEARVRERTTQLARSNEKLQSEIEQRRNAEAAREQLLQRLVTSQEEERRRISRELHDQMGQQLTALLMGLKALPEPNEPGLRPPSSSRQLETLQNLAADLMQQMHRLAWELRPAALDNLGLDAALRQHVREWAHTSGIKADFVASGLAKTARLPLEVETALYRVVQEALTNVQRHAGARHVSVLLERQEHSIAAIIEDDGGGFEVEPGENGAPPPASHRLGLLGMQERLELVSGTLTIESSPAGTTIYARAPLVGA